MTNSVTAHTNLHTPKATEPPKLPDPLEGRRPEIERLLKALETSTEGLPTFVLVTGPAGVGKEELLGAVRGRLAAGATTVLHARCRPGQASYQPLVEVARGALQRLCDCGVAHPRSEQLLATLTGRAQPRGVGQDGLGHDGLGHDGLGQSDKIALFDELAELLIAASQPSPVALMISDLDVADPATRQVVFYLARMLTSAPLLARSAYRGMIVASAADSQNLDGSDQSGANGWSDGVNLTTLQVGGLGPDGVRAFLASERVVERVMRATAGMPRALEALVNRGAVDELEPLRDLRRHEAELLEVLAVFGQPLGPETLQELSGLSYADVARAISSLMDRGLIEKLIADGELRIAYTRVGDQTAIYDRVDPERRRALHGAIGGFLRGHSRRRNLEAAACHLLLGGRDEVGVEAALAAGQRLEIAFCHERAADLYERASEAAQRPADRLELAERLCSLHEATGQISRALEQAEKLRQLSGDDPELALRIARLHLRRGDLAAARDALGRIEQPNNPDERLSSLQARVLAYSAEAHYLAGEMDLALADAETCLSHFRRCAPSLEMPDRRAWINVQNTVGMVHLEREELPAARGLFADNLQQAREAGLASEEVRATIQLGLTQMKLGDFREAERCYQRARKRAEAVGEHRYLGACLQHLGVLAERRRDYQRALSCYQEAVNVWKKVGHRSYLAWVGLDLGKLYLDLGDVARASAMVALSDRLADSEPPVVTRINLSLLRGRIAQRQCRYGEAAARYEEAHDLAAAAGHADRAYRARLCALELQLERGEDQLARDAFERLGLAPQGATRLRALVLRGSLHERQGDLEAARMDLAEALELGHHLHDREALWEVKYLLAMIARQEGRASESRRLLDEAAGLERQVREAVPAEFRPLVAEQPRRVALHKALTEVPPAANAMGSVESVVEAATDTPEPPPRARRRVARRRHRQIIGDHARMNQVLAQVDKVGPTDALVLIRGESGTGKELIADAIHRASPRAKRPLIKVNCGALVENLLLSELFGHERGAFTGATQRRIGRFELADGGTIFLDEIGDISPKTQVALLRVLQERAFERVGGTSQIRVDVRIIFATNRDLEQMVAEGQFREDLYYRLKGVQIELPPLRQRAGDISLLADHFLEAIGRERDTEPLRLGDGALALLEQHGWPGNVRELENVLRSVSLFSEGPELEPGDFGDYPELSAAAPAHRSGPPPLPQPSEPPRLGDDAYTELRSAGCSLRDLKKRVERECIHRALSESDGNITKAAELLGMKRPRLSQLVKEHGIDVQAMIAGGAR